MFKFPVGIRAKDKITGFEGVISARCENVTMCNTYLITPPIREGKRLDSEWFDEPRIEVTDATPVVKHKSQQEVNPAPTK